MTGIHGFLTTEEEKSHKDIPDTLLSKGSTDVGHIKGIEPVKLPPKSFYRSHQRKYPVKKEAEDLNKAGIKECPDSMCNTPVSCKESIPITKMEVSAEPPSSKATMAT